MSHKCFPLIFYGMKGEWLSLSAFVFVIFHELKGEWFWLSACIMSCKCLTLLIFSRCEGWVAFLFSFHDVTRFLPPRVCIPSRCDHHGVIITVWSSRCEGWVAFLVSFHDVTQMLPPHDFFHGVKGEWLSMSAFLVSPRLLRWPSAISGLCGLPDYLLRWKLHLTSHTETTGSYDHLISWTVSNGPHSKLPCQHELVNNMSSCVNNMSSCVNNMSSWTAWAHEQYELVNSMSSCVNSMSSWTIWAREQHELVREQYELVR